MRRCLRFLRTTPKGIWMTYGRGTGFLAMTFLDVLPPYIFFADRASHELSLLITASLVVLGMKVISGNPE